MKQPLRHGDVIIKPITRLPNSLSSEAILECGCHKITTDGQVFSKLKQVARSGQQGFKTEVSEDWAELSPVNHRGYKGVNIHGKQCRVHRLVAQQFIPNTESYRLVLHKNDIKDDNRVENLMWGNAKINKLHQSKNGKATRGTANGNSKINEEIAMKIFQSRGTLQSIADKFRVSKKNVLLIKQKKAWKHIHKQLANKLVVAYGESTGHSHVLKCAEPIYYYRDGGKLYFELTDIGTLTHQEHKTITIEPGSFEIEIERERDPFLEEIKQVID